jgi:hypothetical protein
MHKYTFNRIYQGEFSGWQGSFQNKFYLFMHIDSITIRFYNKVDVMRCISQKYKSIIVLDGTE